MLARFMCDSRLALPLLTVDFETRDEHMDLQYNTLAARETKVKNHGHAYK